MYIGGKESRAVASGRGGGVIDPPGSRLCVHELAHAGMQVGRHFLGELPPDPLVAAVHMWTQ